MPSAAATPPNARRVLDVREGYAEWAATYDTDGNPLTALDTLMLGELLPAFLRMLQEQEQEQQRQYQREFPDRPCSENPSPPLVFELGCGTGRASLALLRAAATADVPVRLLGLDASPHMLARAREKAAALLTVESGGEVEATAEFREFDIGLLDSDGERGGSGDQGGDSNGHDAAAAAAIPHGRAAGVLSALVVEHFPSAHAYFRACAAALRPGGVLLATNMHADMGRTTGAGFEGVRVRGYAHTMSDVAEAAAAAGFVPAHGGDEAVLERAVEGWMVREDIAGLARRGGKWEGCKIWMGGLWRPGGGR